MEALTLALQAGFTRASPLDVSTLRCQSQVRAMCAADRCGAYGKNHTCPPACGTLEACQRRLQSCHQGLLLLTTGTLEDEFDYEAMRETEKRHNGSLRRFAAALKLQYPHALCLGSGGCRICQVCAYPAPCRFPELALSSMEAYGLAVSEICRANGAAYRQGPDTVTFVACALY